MTVMEQGLKRKGFKTKVRIEIWKILCYFNVTKIINLDFSCEFPKRDFNKEIVRFNNVVESSWIMCFDRWIFKTSNLKNSNYAVLPFKINTEYIDKFSIELNSAHQGQVFYSKLRHSLARYWISNDFSPLHVKQKI